MKFIEIGTIVKTHGLRGRLKVMSHLQAEEVLSSLKEVFIQEKAGEKTLYPVKEIQGGRGNFLLHLEGVNDIEKASSFVGSRVFMNLEHEEKLSDDEYYWRDLLGLVVVTEGGRILGEIKGIFPTGSNDVYVCNGGEREILLPAITEVVRKVDIEKGIMVVRLLDGL